MHGTWIDADQEPEDILQEIKLMLIDSPESEKECSDEECGYKGPADEYGECPACGMPYTIAEEWMICDSEGFSGIRIEPHEDIETVSALGKFIETLDAERAEAFAAWYENDDHEIDSLEDDFNEAYCGTFGSLDEWAEEYAESTGMLDSMPDNLRFYFDFKRFARDCEIGGDIWTHEGELGLHIFNNI
jgi:antirestriction protein